MITLLLFVGLYLLIGCFAPLWMAFVDNILDGECQKYKVKELIFTVPLWPVILIMGISLLTSNYFSKWHLPNFMNKEIKICDLFKVKNDTTNHTGQ